MIFKLARQCFDKERWLCSFGLVLLGAGVLPAADVLPGHSTHGEAFDEGPRQAAVLMEGCGRIRFPITTKNEMAQRFFEQGVGQLHGFWYYEAERSFRQVLLLDPNCAMAYWGCAMANVNNAKRAATFIKEAERLKGTATPREQAWISSLSTYYNNPNGDKRRRELNFIENIEGIVQDFPEDLEAKAFLAWAIWNSRESGVQMVSREAVDSIISQVLVVEPMHPVHHYRIHLWDDTKPNRALASAGLCGQCAPAIAHMWHMPGHIYSKIDQPENAAWCQEAADRVDHAYMISRHILPDQIHNYAHNAEWFIRSLSELGEAHKAIQVAKYLIENPRHPRWNSITKADDSATYGRIRLFDVMLKFGLWDEMGSLEGSPFLDQTSNLGLEVYGHRALGIAAFFRQDIANLGRHIASLNGMQTTLASSNSILTGKGEAAGQTTEGTPQVAIRRPLAYRKPSSAAKSSTSHPQISAALAELQSLQVMLYASRRDEALTLLQSCKDIPKDRLIRYYDCLGDKDKVSTLANQLSNDVPSLALKVLTLANAAKWDETKAVLSKLGARGGAMDSDLPWTKRLNEIAASLGFPEHWLLPKSPNVGGGIPRDLESLGPLGWHPFPAPSFDFKTGQQGAISLSSYAGRPLVLIFYLGGSCEHCVRQLHAFSEAAGAFRAAGMEILAVGSQVETELKNDSFLKPEASLAVMADPELKTFREYGCYDDFENKPLHGTFLIDGRGAIRWFDVGFEPFSDTGFLLSEGKRLLSFSYEDKH